MKLLGWVFIACATSTAVAARQPEEIVVWLKARAEISADGTVKTLAWDDARPVERLFAEKVDPVVRRWRFVAGQIDGRPADTQTSLRLAVQGSAHPDGTLKLRVLDAATGAGTALVVPKYPPAAFRGAASALVTTIVSVDPAGKVSVESAEFKGDNGHRLVFIEAVTLALKESNFHLERVAGQPIAARIRIPFSFCMSKGCRYERDAVDPKRRERPNTPVALDSAVRLVTDVRDLDI